MENLSFPPFDYRLRQQGGTPRIYDVIRRRYVVLTPEEWVRQHLVHYLIDYKACPAGLVALEKEIDLYGRPQRFDVVVYSRQGAPWLLVECKAPSVPLSVRVFDQACRYNLTLAAPYLAVTNGIRHYCLRLEPGAEPLFLDDFPQFCSSK